MATLGSQPVRVAVAAASSRGWTTLPLDFDIFSSPRRIQAWAMMCFGSGSPAPRSIAGQRVAWNRVRISFPSHWHRAGHFSSHPGLGQPVAVM